MECVFGAELEQWSLVTKVLPSDFGSQSASERLTLASFALGSSILGNKTDKLRAVPGNKIKQVPLYAGNQIAGPLQP